jgi:putative spermidine/putrescine transport system permease protein
MSGPLSKRLVLGTVVGAILVLLAAPTVIVLGASVTSGTSSSSRRTASACAGTRGWRCHDFRDALLRTAYVSTVCALIALPVGTLAAIGLGATGCASGAAIQVYLLLPFTIPLVVSGLG